MSPRQAKALAEWMEVAESVTSPIADRLLDLAQRVGDTDRSALIVAVMLIRGAGSAPSSQSEIPERTRREREKRAQNLYESLEYDADDVR
jgi:hypothetical protein